MSVNHRELTLRGIFIAIVLTVLLAMSNAYLALKLGILTSASIPAAILSMGILRFFKQSTVLENNAIQTAASAGEAVAGGIVYTIPALIMIEYWYHFDYLTNFFIALSGGVLGVLFSIPLRRILVNDDALKFPEGRAIAAVLKTSAEKIGLSYLVWGGVIGATLELFQSGFKLIASSVSYWVVVKKTLLGFGLGFSATMIGAGYMVGFDMALSIFLGAIFSWGVLVPLASHLYPAFLNAGQLPQDALMGLWNTELRYVGIGAMLFAGIWTFIKLSKPLMKRMMMSFDGLLKPANKNSGALQTDKDMPMSLIITGVLLMAIALYVFFQSIFPLDVLGLGEHYTNTVVLGAVLYILVVGFLFSVITAYFSGMVGVTASPGSSVVIAGILFAAWLLLSLVHAVLPLPFDAQQLKAAEAITIIIGSIVTGIAAIANDNSQDLKVGQLVGATPWKQQLMLLLGVLVSSTVIPPVMQLLFNVYGIAGIMPHEGMDMTQSLPAPTAALLAAITEAVFQNKLPWMMMSLGAFIIGVVIALNHVFKIKRYVQLSVLGVAVGMYLPLSSSLPLFLGGMISWIATRDQSAEKKQVGALIACGLVAGSALMNVVLALPFSLMHSPNALSLVSPSWDVAAGILGLASTGALGWWMISRVRGSVC